MTTSFLLIVQIILVVILVIAVLLQKSSSIGLGAYSGSNDSVFGAKGPSSFLAKTTFMYSSAKGDSVVNNMVETTDVVAPTTPAPVVPAAIENNTTTQK
jgi:preprotein translocase subunit SecG